MKMKVIGLTVLLIVAAVAHAQSQPLPLHLFISNTIPTPGFYRLEWEWVGERAPPGSVQFELQESTDENFSGPAVMYRGPDYAAVVTGVSNGEIHYRVRAVNMPGGPLFSNIVTVTTAHESTLNRDKILATILLVLIMGWFVRRLSRQ